MDKFNGTDLCGNSKVTMKLEKSEFFFEENKNSKLKYYFSFYLEKIINRLISYIKRQNLIILSN